MSDGTAFDDFASAQAADVAAGAGQPDLTVSPLAKPLFPGVTQPQPVPAPAATGAGAPSGGNAFDEFGAAAQADAQSGFKPPSAQPGWNTGDVAKSLGSGIVRGAVGMVTAPAALADMALQFPIDAAHDAYNRVFGNNAGGQSVFGGVQAAKDAIINAPMDAAHWAYNKVFGPSDTSEKVFGAIHPGKMGIEISNAAQSALDPYLHTPQSTAGAGAERLGEFLPGLAAAPEMTVGSLAGAAGKYVVAPAVGSYLGEKATANDPLLAPYGSTLGGLGAPLALEGVGAAGRGIAAKTGIGATIADKMGNPQYAQNRAAQTYFDQQQNPQAVADALANPPNPEGAPGTQFQTIEGVQPTTAEVTNDPGGLNVQRGDMTANPGYYQGRLAQQNEARVNSLKLDFDAAPADVANHVQNRIDQIQQQANDAVEAARTSGDRNVGAMQEMAAGARANAQGQTDAALAGARTAQEQAHQGIERQAPEQIGERLRQTLDERNAAAKTEENALHCTVDPTNSLVVSMDPVHAQVARVYGNLTPVEQANLSPAETKMLGILSENYQNPVAGYRDMGAISSQLAADMRQELYANGRSVAYRRMKLLMDGVKESLYQTVHQVSAAEAQQIRDGLRDPRNTLAARLGNHANGLDAGNSSARRAGVGGGTPRQPGSQEISDFPGDRGTAGAGGAGSGGAPGDTGVSQETGAQAPRVTTPKPEGAPPQSLVDFIRRNGGMRDEGGDYAAAGLDQQHRGLITRNGMHPDKMREAAAEAGYLGGDTARAVSETTPRDLMEAVQNHPTYSVHDTDRVLQLRDRATEQAKVEEFNRARQEVLDDIYREHGVGEKNLDDRLLNAATYHLMEDPHLSGREAYQRALDESAQRYRQETAHIREGWEKHFDEHWNSGAKADQNQGEPGAGAVVSGAGEASQRNGAPVPGGERGAGGTGGPSAEPAPGGENRNGQGPGLGRETTAVYRASNGETYWVVRAPDGSISNIVAPYGSVRPAPGVSYLTDAEALGHTLGSDPRVFERTDHATRPGSTPEGFRQARPTYEVDPAVRERQQAANQATIARKRTFESGPVGQVLRPGRVAGEFRMSDSKVPENLFRRGALGADAVRGYFEAAGRGPDAMRAMHEAAVNELANIAAKNQGVVTPAGLNTWKNNFRDALRAIDDVTPGFSSRFDNAAHATAEVERLIGDQRRVLDATQRAGDDLVKAARKAADEAVKDTARTGAQAVKDAQRGILGRIAKAQSDAEVVSHMQSLLTSPRRAAEARDLVAAIRGNEHAMTALKQATADAFSKQVTSKQMVAGSDQRVLDMVGIRSKFDAALPTLREILDPEHIAHIERVVRSAEMAERAYSGAKIKGQSNTAQDLAAMSKNAGAEHAATGTSAGHGHGLMGAGPLAIGGMILEHFGEHLPAMLQHGAEWALGGLAGYKVAKATMDAVKRLGMSSTQRYLQEMIRNPEFAAQMAKRVSPTMDARQVRINGLIRQAIIKGVQSDQKQAKDGPQPPSPPRGGAPRERIEPTMGTPPASARDAAMASPVTQTPEFRNWFGESKVVDKKGQPLVVYHGSPDARWLNDPKAAFGDKYKNMGVQVQQHFFTDDPVIAKSYADDNRAWDYQNAEPGVSKYYLSLKNPKEIDAGGERWRGTAHQIEIARRDGHDGVIIRNVRDHYNAGLEGLSPKKDRVSTVYVAFEPEQIKSADRNSGSFNSNDPSVYARVESGPALQNWATGETVAPQRSASFRDMAGEHLSGPIASRLASLVGDVPVHVVDDASMEKLAGGGRFPGVDAKGYRVQGFWNRDDNSIVMRKSVMDSPNGPVVLQHEAVHAATVHAMLRNPDAEALIDRLRQEAITAHERSGGKVKDHYGFTNAREFVAEAFSSPEFQARLKSIKAPAGIAEGLGLKGTRRTLWDAFRQAIHRILGLRQTPPSMLDATMAAGNWLMTEQAARQNGGVVRPMLTGNSSAGWGQAAGR